MNQQVGIALSGGAARGIAHIGVLQALEEAGISPAYVSGASAGAIVGALYAAGKSPEEILSIVKSTSILKLFRPTVPTMGLTDLSAIKEILADHIQVDSFSGLKRTLFISVTNMTKGRFEIVSEGSLFETVTASCSIPILFKAREKDHDVYVDGGVLNNLPVEPLRERCPVVVGVNVTPIKPEQDLDDLIAISYRTLSLAMWANVKPRLEQCDVIIEPSVQNVAFFDIEKADEIFQQGYEAAKPQIATLRKMIEARPGGHEVHESSTQEETSAARSGSSYIPPLVGRIGKAVSQGGRRLLRTNRTVEASTEKEKAQLPPGAMFYVGRQRVGPTILSVMRFNVDGLEEEGMIDLDEMKGFLSDDKVTWFNVDGVHNASDIEQLGKELEVHSLTLEDILNTRERPKFESIGNHLFLRVKMLTNLPGQNKVDVEQVGLLLGKGYVVSFQEKSEDVLEPLRERIREAKGRVRKAGPDYLFFAIIDMVVSHYFGVVEEISEKMARVEARILDQRMDSKILGEIHELKKATSFLRRNIYPLRSALGELMRDETGLISSKVKPYFNDLEDELLHVIENIEVTHGALNDLSDQFLALSGHKANDIMKVLTIIATIFIPLTFIVGVYGMNFEYMPELKYRYGYFAVWGVMIGILVLMVIYFRRKRWL